MPPLRDGLTLEAAMMILIQKDTSGLRKMTRELLPQHPLIRRHCPGLQPTIPFFKMLTRHHRFEHPPLFLPHENTIMATHPTAPSQLTSSQRGLETGKVDRGLSHSLCKVLLQKRKSRQRHPRT